MTEIIIKNTSKDDVKRLIVIKDEQTKGFKISNDNLKTIEKEIADIFSEDLK